MAFGGVKKDPTRADLLAYLATLSEAPKPFPAP
jgi:cytochrome c2